MLTGGRGGLRGARRGRHPARGPAAGGGGGILTNKPSYTPPRQTHALATSPHAVSAK